MALADFLSSSFVLECLDLSGANVDVSFIATALKDNQLLLTKLRFFDISHNKLPKPTTRVLAEWLSKCSALSHLDLSWCKPTREGLESIVTSIVSNRSPSPAPPPKHCSSPHIVVCPPIHHSVFLSSSFY